tara:strand:- start:27 stop:470 length:444 start_codon:yes stop_codon:yes gene_type:complete
MIKTELIKKIVTSWYIGGLMLEWKKIFIVVVWLSLFLLVGTQQAYSQASGHASVGLGHGEEGYLHLEEMIKHLEFGLKMPDAGQDLQTHGSVAVKHAREALKHYNEALKHANESLGRPTRNPLMGGGSGSEHSHEEGSPNSHEEGSH